MNTKFITYIIIIALSINLLFLINERFFNEKNRNILVMYSGGLDSTTSLYKLLKNTSHNIYVHHVILKDNSDRWKSELNVTREIVNYLKVNIRNFDYTESTIDLRLQSIDKKGGSRHDDLSSIVFTATQICTIEIYKSIDYIVISNLECEMDEKVKKYIQNMIDIQHKKRWAAKKPKMIDPLKEFYNKKCSLNMKNINKLKEIASEKIIQEYKSSDITTDLFKEIICTKREMYNYLPKTLQNKIVYCREPVNNKMCNKCFNCMLYKNII